MAGRVPVASYVIGAYALGYYELLMFVLTLRCAELGFSLAEIGIVVGVGGLGSAVLAIPLGGLVDRYGPRTAFIATTAATGVLSLALTLADGLAAMLVLQFVVGCTRTMAWVSSQGYVTSVSAPAERATHAGRFGFFVGAGQLLTVLAAGLVTQVAGARAGFVLGAAYSVVFVLVALPLPAVGAGTRRRAAGGFGEALRLARAPGVQTAMLLTFSRLWIVSAFSAFMPLILVGDGVPPAVAGAVIAAKGAVTTVSSLAAGALSRRVGLVPLGVASLAAGALGLALAPWLHGTVPLFVPPVLVGLAMGLSLPVILATLTVDTAEENRALALSMRESANSTAATLGPPVVGRLMLVAGFRGGALVAAATCALLLASAAVRSRRIGRSASSARSTGV